MGAFFQENDLDIATVFKGFASVDVSSVGDLFFCVAIIAQRSCGNHVFKVGKMAELCAEGEAVSSKLRSLILQVERSSQTYRCIENLSSALEHDFDLKALSQCEVVY